MARRRVQLKKTSIDVALEARLWNWGRWVRTSDGRRNHCRSIEWRFSLPKFRAMDLEAAGVKSAEIAEILGKPDAEPIDEGDAWRVELAVTSFGAPARVTALLRAYYVMRLLPHPTCRALKIGFHRFNEELAAAARFAESALRIVDLRKGKT